MTLEEIYAMLTSTGYPATFYEFPVGTGEVDAAGLEIGPPMPPYIVYLTPDMGIVAADGVVVYKLYTVQVELYTFAKDTAAEATVEAVLKNSRITFEKSEIGIPEEGLYKVKYEFENVEGAQ